MNTNQKIQRKSELGSVMGTASQEKRSNDRLAHIIDFEPLRPTEGHKMLTITTENHFTGVKHLIIISHDPGNGTDRFNVNLDAEKKWRNGWSKTRFGKWVADQIDSVRSDWS